nr:hypothetical protein TDPV-011 [Oriental turtle dovepox virus]
MVALINRNRINKEYHIRIFFRILDIIHRYNK